jgi:hypothetical protein
MISPRQSVDAFPDPGDAPFWECAEAGGADFIVTLNKQHFPQRKLAARVIQPATQCHHGGARGVILLFEAELLPLRQAVRDEVRRVRVRVPAAVEERGPHGLAELGMDPLRLAHGPRVAVQGSGLECHTGRRDLTCHTPGRILSTPVASKLQS